MKYFKSGYAISLLLLFVIILLPIQVFAEMPPLPPGNDNTDDSGEDIITVNTNLIRSINGKKVYEVINGKRHWVPTAEIFDSRGFRWSDVQIISESQLNAYPRTKLLRVTNNKKVYYLTESGMIRHIPTTQVFESYGNNWNDVCEITSNELNSYKLNELIKTESDPKVYLLENGVKRWIQTAEIFNAKKYDWTKIAPVNQLEMNHYSVGSPIST
jgi:hypothetical protein